MTAAITGNFVFDVRVREHRGEKEMPNVGSTGKLGG